MRGGKNEGPRRLMRSRTSCPIGKAISFTSLRGEKSGPYVRDRELTEGVCVYTVTGQMAKPSLMMRAQRKFADRPYRQKITHTERKRRYPKGSLAFSFFMLMLPLSLSLSLFALFLPFCPSATYSSFFHCSRPLFSRFYQQTMPLSEHFFALYFDDFNFHPNHSI